MRIDVRVKAAYERAIYEKYGLIRPYAGVDLERELAALVGDGRLSDLFDAVHRLSEALGETPRQKKTHMPSRSESVMCRFRIRDEVREKVMALAEERDVTYPRDLVERVMWDYAQDRSAVDKAVDRMGRIRDRAESELGASDSTTERRKLELVNELSKQSQWTLTDFDRAVDEHVSGISSGQYARERYLRAVLDELAYTWHPDNEEVFLPDTTDFLPAQRDPRSKPYLLMDRADKLEAVRQDAIEAAERAPTKRAKYHVKTGVSMLGGRPNQQTVEYLLRDLASNDDRFRWDESEGVALVTSESQTGGSVAREVDSELDQLTNATPARNGQ